MTEEKYTENPLSPYHYYHSWYQHDFIREPDISDKEIRQSIVEDLLENDFSIELINIEVKNARVYLFGPITSRQEKKAMEERIEKIDGVIDIMNNLYFETITDIS